MRKTFLEKAVVELVYKFDEKSYHECFEKVSRLLKYDSNFFVHQHRSLYPARAAHAGNNIVDINLWILPRTRSASGGKVIGAGVHIVCGQKKLNHTLAIESPFQTFAVGLLVKFID